LLLSSIDDTAILSPSGDNGNSLMHIRTPLELGLIIRDRRRKLGLSQSELAEKAGVGRQWLVAVEHGKARAEIGLVLRTLAALGLTISVDGGDRNRKARTHDDITPVDIDAVVSSLKKNTP